MQGNSPQSERLLRVGGVLSRVPVSKSTWWAWVRSGYAPQPVKAGPNTTVWLESDIDAFIARMREERVA